MDSLPTHDVICTHHYGNNKNELSEQRRIRKDQQFGDGLSDDIVFQFREVRKFPPVKAFDGKYMEFDTEFEIEHNLGQYQNDLFMAQELIDDAFEAMVKPFLLSANPDDKISVTMETGTDEGSFYVSFVGPQGFDKEELLNALASLAQSNRTAIFKNGKLNLKIGVLKKLQGGGKIPNNKPSAERKSRKPITTTSFFKNKDSIIHIKNLDHRCGYLAVTIGLKYVRNPKIRQNGGKNEWDELVRQKGSNNSLVKAMEKLFMSWNINTETMLDFEKIKQIEQREKDIQIIVIDRPTDPANSKVGEFSYMGPDRLNKIVLEWVDHSHFNYVKNIATYYGFRQWCYGCFKGFNRLVSHRCDRICNKCGVTPKCEAKKLQIYCDKCNLEFNSVDCYANHQSRMCIKRKLCDKCNVLYQDDPHICFHYRCQGCKQMYTATPHYCSIQPLDKTKLVKDDSINKIIVTFDIEAIQSEPDPNTGYSVFKANLVISHTICDFCYSNNEQKKEFEICPRCGEHEHRFFGDSCIESFITYICDEMGSKIGKTTSTIYVWAHNFKGFDSRFILTELWKRNYLGVKIIMAGSKVIKIDVGCVRFLDSLSFFQMSLANCAKSFKGNLSMVKGDFPHGANKEENYNYVGPMFPISDYPIKYMPVDKKAAFLEWYNDQIDSNYVFRFHDELVKYCRNDVAILEFTLMEFRKLFKIATDLDIFTRVFTLAAVGLETYRASMMLYEIGIVPLSGYVPIGNSSVKEHAWLDYIQKNKNIIIIRQYRIGPYYCDGYHEETRTVYEFLGCHYHGCLKCFKKDRNKNIYREQDGIQIKTTYHHLLLAWQKRKQTLEEMGFSVSYIWEHELQFDSYIESRLEAWRKIQSLGKSVIRDSFFGGRTNNFIFNYIAEENEKILYLDFTSLYPYVLKYRSYPIGHPKIVTEDFDHSLPYFGFVSCRVLPPENLEFPILPYRVKCQTQEKKGEKLLFPLCSRCAEIMAVDFCYHSDEERCIEGTWTSVELKAAVEKGYKIRKIYLVHDYGSRVTSNMFTEYIDKWLRLKQQSSGWPSHAVTEEQRLKYIEEYEMKEGIKLNYDEVSRNDGLRLISKLCLNSFWGKLGQRANMKQTEPVTSYQRLWELECDQKIKILGKTIVSPKSVMVNYEYINVEDSRPGNTSPAIASFVTSYARLKLYELMEQVNTRPGRLLYVDTDSAIFVHAKDDPIIPTGDYLGELTDEFEKDYAGFTCYQAICAGPKSYSLKLRKYDNETNTMIEKSIMKCKGISFSGATKDSLNPKIMENLANKFVKTGERDEVQVPQQQFSAVAMKQIMRRREFTKQFKVTSDKRIVKDGLTFPFGWRTGNGIVRKVNKPSNDEQIPCLENEV